MSSLPSRTTEGPTSELWLVGACATWSPPFPAHRAASLSEARVAPDAAVVVLEVRSASDLEALVALRRATAAVLFVVTDPAPDADLLTALYALQPLDHVVAPVLPVVCNARLGLHLAAHVQSARFRFVGALDEAIREPSDPEAVMATAARLLGQHLVVSRCAYAHVLDDGDTFVIRHDYTDGCPSSVGEYSLDRFGPRAAADMRAGGVLVVCDVPAELAPDEGGAMFLAIGVQAIVCCGLVKDGRLVAMMAVHQTAPRCWRAEAVALVQESVERCWAHIERARSARALRQSEARFRTLVTTTSVVVWTADGGGEIVSDNPSWSAFTGQSREAYSGRGWLDAVHPDDRAEIGQRWDAAIATRVPSELVFRLRRADGAYRHVVSRFAPIFRADGSIREWIGDVNDVTEQRAAEAYRVEQERRKDEFVAMSAHELRNPLGPIRNAMHLLSLTRDEATLDRVRRTVGRQVDHLAHIVDDLLEMSRVTTGRVRLRRERPELGRLVDHVVEDARPSCTRDGIMLALSLPDTPVWVDGDRTRLTQVVDNLVANSLKFTDHGGRIIVRLAATDDEAVLVVSDDGIGIEPELLPRLFEPFTQADRTLDRSQGGLGLGLAMVKGFTELHGGRVSARSPGKGQGTEMTVVLPRIAEPPALSVSPAFVPRATTPRRVLVIEDNRDAADTLQLLLELSGCEVAVAYTGPDGVARALAWLPEVVICDIGLPGMNGYDVARTLRAELVGAPPVLIALTGYGEDEDRRRAVEAGFDRHFTKPMDPDELQDLVTA